VALFFEEDTAWIGTGVVRPIRAGEEPWHVELERSGLEVEVRERVMSGEERAQLEIPRAVFTSPLSS